jgi:cephalosporin-C deacetylase-like acetyl esterase
MVQPFKERIDRFYDVRGQVGQFLIDRSAMCFDRADELRAAIAGPDDVRAWKQRTREALLEAFGGLPIEASTTPARIVGTVDQPDYRIEKLIIESLPDVPVTANLYVPHDHQAPGPAVLLFCGHARDAKAAPKYQQAASMFARNGFVVLVADPIGQGERMQCIDRATGGQFVSWGTHEHSHLGLLCTLCGGNIARYMIHDDLCALNYLMQRPEVDPQRVGITGNSGGGTQTCYLMTLDDRIAAAAPGCYVTTRRHYMPSQQAHDAEQNLFAAIPNHLEHEDMLIAFAPRPVMVLSAAYDFFPIEGAEKAYRGAKRIYELLGAGDDCQMTVGPHPHGYNPPLQRAALRFFTRYLMGDDHPPLKEESGPVLNPAELLCTSSSQVLVDLPEARAIQSYIREHAPAAPTAQPDEVRQQVRRLVTAERNPPPLRPRVLFSMGEEHDLYWDHTFFFSEQGIAVTGIMVRPRRTVRAERTTIMLMPEGTNRVAKDDLLQRLADYWTGNQAMYLFDPRGTGAVEPSIDPFFEMRNRYGPWFKQSSDAWMLGDNMVCMRAFDVLRAAEYLRSRDDVDPAGIALYGEGEMGIVALLAALAMEPNPVGVDLVGMPDDYRHAVETGNGDYRLVNEWTTIHGMLGQFDLPDLRAACHCPCRTL